MKAATEPYRVIARRSGRWWAVEVPALPGVFTQARTLDGVEPIVRDAIALVTGSEPASIAVDIQSEAPPQAQALVAEALARRAEADRAQAAASDAMHRAVTSLAGVGLTNRDAGRLLGVSHQRIAQISASSRQRTTR